MASAREGVRGDPPNAAGNATYGDPVMWLTVVAVFAAYTAISVSRYVRHDPASWDLGIFTEAVKDYAHFHAPLAAIRGQGFNLLGDHFHPALAVLAPFFGLFPSPVTLLVAQAVLCAVSVVPITRAAIALLGVSQGRLIGAAHGFSWGLASLNWYDFHEVALAVPLTAFAVSALARRRPIAAAAWSAPLVFVKEDQGFTVAAIGLVIAFAYRRGEPLAGITGVLLAMWGIAWSLLSIYVIIPHFNPAHQYPYWEKGAHLDNLTGQLAAGAAVKLPTLVLLLLPTALVALRSPIAAVAIPGLLLRFISADTSYWGTGWHYNAVVMPVVFAAAIDGLVRIRNAREAVAQRATVASGVRAEAGIPTALSAARRPSGMLGKMVSSSAVWARSVATGLERHAPAMMGAMAIALAFQFPLQNLWNPESYKLSRHVHTVDNALKLIPPGVTVETSLDELAPLAAHDDTYWVGNQNPPPQWILFDQRSPEWSISNVPAFVGSRHRQANFQVVYADDGVWLLRRSGQTG